MSEQDQTEAVEPLDPREGPTLWARIEEAEHEAVTLLCGDPDDPYKKLRLSESEFRRLRRAYRDN